MSRLSVVVPVYNEEAAIGHLLQRILAVTDALQQEAGITELEVVVVDDGSTDRTAHIVEALARAHSGPAAVRLIRHPVNLGYGAALQTGFAASRGSLLAFLDGDLTYPPESLPALCRAAQRPGVRLVLGDRMTGRDSHMPPERRLGNALFALLTSLLCGTRLADCCSGMRVLPARAWQRLGPLPTGLEFSPSMTVRALQRGLALEQVPIPYHERVGSSKLKVLRDGLRFLAAIVGEAWRYRPGRVCFLGGATGACLIGAGAGLALLALQPTSYLRLGAGILLIAPALGVLTFLLARGDLHAKPLSPPRLALHPSDGSVKSEELTS
ncbi:MAG: glycosyltransferase family 2 protein [Anaerolineae bacterium]|nr:glycosyltransferase family 2 protein [Anaerolineae bacterium]